MGTRANRNLSPQEFPQYVQETADILAQQTGGSARIYPRDKHGDYHSVVDMTGEDDYGERVHAGGHQIPGRTHHAIDLLDVRDDPDGPYVDAGYGSYEAGEDLTDSVPVGWSEGHSYDVNPNEVSGREIYGRWRGFDSKTRNRYSVNPLRAVD